MRYTITTTPTLLTATAESGIERFLFPYTWRGWKRVYTGFRVSDTAPQREWFVGGEWEREDIDMLVWLQWTAVLESLPAHAHGTTLEVEQYERPD